MQTKTISKTAWLLYVTRLFETSDESSLREVTFNIGLFEKEKDLFRVMRIIRENNPESVKLHITTVTNPRFISSTDKSLISKLF